MGLGHVKIRNQRPDPSDIHYSGQIIGQNREGYLSGYFWESFGQEVRRSHACLHRSERMLDGLATKAHRGRAKAENPAGLIQVMVA